MVNLFMIAIGLSMDAFAVSMTNGLCASQQKSGKGGAFFSQAFRWSFLFALFQGLMPLLGYFLGRTFAQFISSVDHWVAFLLLAFIGGKMIWEAIHPDPEEESCRTLSLQAMVTQAVATSIDALAVGVSFALLQTNIVFAASFIALVTLVCCLVGSYLGRTAGGLLRSKAEIFGGAVLVLIGVKILLEHTVLA